jgi:hypothetical protein
MLGEANKNYSKIEEVRTKCVTLCEKEYNQPRITSYRPSDSLKYQKVISELIGTRIRYLSFYYDGVNFSGLLAHISNNEFLFTGKNAPNEIEIAATTYKKIKTSKEFHVYRSSSSSEH